MSIYNKTTRTVDHETGEIKDEHEVDIKRDKDIPEEMQFIRVYKYLNTYFAYKNIPTTLTNYIVEFGRYMSPPEQAQTIAFNAWNRKRICETLGVSIGRLDQVIRECVNHGILIKTEYRGIYSVSPYIISHGKENKVQELRAYFDFMADNAVVGFENKNMITGEEVRKVISEKKSKVKTQIQGQLTFEELFGKSLPAKEESAPKLSPDEEKLLNELLDIIAEQPNFDTTKLKDVGLTKEQIEGLLKMAKSPERKEINEEIREKEAEINELKTKMEQLETERKQLEMADENN